MEFRDKISRKFYSGWSSWFLFVIAGWKKRSRCDIFPSEILKQPLETMIHREKLWPPFSKLNKFLDETSLRGFNLYNYLYNSSYIILFLTMGSCNRIEKIFQSCSKILMKIHWNDDFNSAQSVSLEVQNILLIINRRIGYTFIVHARRNEFGWRI